MSSAVIMAAELPLTPDRASVPWEGARTMTRSGHRADGGGSTRTAAENDVLLWFAVQCLSNALRLQTYLEDACRSGDDELADLLGTAPHVSAEGAEIATDLLLRRLGQD